MSNPFAKKIINPENAIDYQENAIVSKTITDNINSSLTVFAFDAGQSIAGHSAPVDAVVLNVEGEVEITISGENFTLKKGDMILMPKGEPHALLAKTKFKMVLFKV
ncbi:MAG: cupin domain-containing protein [Alphaproteobacteria bacterium]|jgi:quercetin dioxygenase-like cupin family protein